MKKSLLAKLCILSLVVVCAAMSFVACKVTTKSIAVNGKSQVFAGEFALADYSLAVTTSDGNTRTEPLTAQNLANVTVEQLQRAGMYNISVVYDGVTTTFALTVVNRTFDGLTFADKAVTYNGSAQSIEVANLPQGATVTYSPSNTFTNAGIYPVTATVSAPNFDTATLSATLTINKATYDMSRVVFADKSVAYDGNAHSLEATNLPDGVTVTYIGNNQTNVGTYTVLAVFSGDSANYNPVANMTATLTVTQNAVQGVTFANRTVTYDGAAHSLAIEGNLPQGIAVVYEGNSQTNAGTYTVTAKFVGSNPNYEQLPDMTATLTIEKRELQIEFVGEQTAAYTGYAQKPLTARATNLCGSDTVTIDITYDGDVVDAGTYVVTATVASDNYKLTANNTCTFTITRATHKITFRQNGQPDKVYNVLDLADFAETIPDVVAVAGYDVSWEEKQLTRVTEDVIVNAVITPTVYKITYILDGGTIPYNAPWQYTIETETFELPAPQRDYYSFEGWYTEETFANRVVQVSQGSTGNVTLYAKWLQTSTEGVQYRQLSDGSYAVSGYDGSSAEVVIASVWRGQPVTAIGNKAFQYCGRLISIVIPNGVTSIGDYAFDDCPSLTSVTIPDSVTSIGNNAFSGCNGLTSITIPDSVTGIGGNAFYNCSKLTNITIPDSVTSIGWFTFYGCSNLKTVTFNNGLKVIGENAFEKCANLPSVTIPDSVTTISESAFFDCGMLSSVTLGSGITSIGRYAFLNSGMYATPVDGVYYVGNWAFDSDKNVSDIQTQAGVQTVVRAGTTGIADSAFRSRGFTEIFLPDSVEYVGQSAFRSCATLRRIDLGANVRVLGESAFRDCSQLGRNRISLGNKLEKIDNYVFANCTDFGNPTYLEIYYNDFTLPSTVKSVGTNAFLNSGFWTKSKTPEIYVGKWLVGYKVSSDETEQRPVYVKEGTVGISNYAFYKNDLITTVTIPESVKHIGMAAFAQCANLQIVNISMFCELEEIPDYAFYKCPMLYEVSVPPTIRRIGRSAFYKSGLMVANIAEDVESIGDYAFYGCESVVEVKFEGTAPKLKTIGNYAFGGVSKLERIVLPDGVTTIGDNAFV